MPHTDHRRLSAYLIPARGLKPTDLSLGDTRIALSANLIPARGLKRVSQTPLRTRSLQTFRLLNPRKGTETSQGSPASTDLITLSAYLIPARGLKHVAISIKNKSDNAFRLLNPRKGTETTR